MQALRRCQPRLSALSAKRPNPWGPRARAQKNISLNHCKISSASSRPGFAGNSNALWALGIIAVTATATILASKIWDSRSDKMPVEARSSEHYADKKTMLHAAREIQQTLGEGCVSFDGDDLDAHGYSEWSTSNSTERPVAVLLPRSTEEVSQIAKICTKYRVPMIPFGAGSSVEGNFSAPFSGVCIDLSQMNELVAFYEEDMNVTVQAGMRWTDLNDREEIKSAGLFLPMDPSPTAFVGGMIATNCSGTNAMRYGTMKDWIVNLTAVLPDGTVIKTKRRPRKSSAGYNLNALFAGSEGTLGIITEATLKLAMIPEEMTVGIATFPTVKDATAAASNLIRAGVPLAALELMDEVQMAIINQNGGAGGRHWSEKPTLFVKFTGTRPEIDGSIQRTKGILPIYKNDQLVFASSESECNSLWAARKEALWALSAVRPENTQIWSTDVAVPISRLAEIVDRSKEESSGLGLFSTVLGHVGDSNFHQAVLYNPEDPEQYQSVKACVSRMMHRALEMEGTVSGEHGIGIGKKSYLEEELGESTLQFMRALKRSVDPHWIMNPGKVFDE